jgi:hypothetical protein
VNCSALADSMRRPICARVVSGEVIAFERKFSVED